MSDVENLAEGQDVVPKGYWQDARGNLVPVSKVKDVDKARDKAVKCLAQAAKDLSAAIANFKLLAMSEVAEFVERSATEYGTTMRGAEGKGNITLTSYDGRYKVERAIAETIAFDERLQVAKQIIDERVHVWSKGANANIKALVNHAFQVDKAGNVSTGRVLSLRTLKVDDPEWDRAMDAIADSMRVMGSKAYVRFYERDAAGRYVAIPLDAAKV